LLGGILVEDKRIIKTKRNLKETMVSLLRRIPFEKINVIDYSYLLL
jgi:hypothetical protein